MRYFLEAASLCYRSASDAIHPGLCGADTFSYIGEETFFDMPKVLLKIVAVLAGLGILIYLLGRRLTNWETEVIQESSGSHSPTIEEPKAHVSPSADGQSAEQVSELKQIKGIGPVIEEKLNGIGYYSLQQIASLTDEEKNRIEEELAFPGRIERDQWVEQAKEILG